MLYRLFLAVVAVCLAVLSVGQASAGDVDFSRDVQPLFVKYCVGCHNPKEGEGGFTCHDFAGVMKGSKERIVVKAGKADESFLLKLMTGAETPQMPPEDEAQPTDAELAIIRTWIEQGAKPSDTPLPLRERLKVAAVESKNLHTNEVTAMHLVDEGRVAALGLYGKVQLRSLTDNELIQEWNDIVGKVTSLRLSANGQKLVIGSGVPGIGGQITVLDLKKRQIERQFEGHRDTIYSAIMSPDGSLIATAGYDRRIYLWNSETGEVVRYFDGHNGAVYDLDFHPSGKLLASCSADETTKIWLVETGKRLDTLSQGEAEQYTVRFTPDGNRIMAAGADRRVRVWRLVSREREAINPMLHACFAHEKAIVALRLSPDGKLLVTAGEDRTIKLWTANNLTPIGELGRVEDIPTDAAWSSDKNRVTIASLSGRMESFLIEGVLQAFAKQRRAATASGKPVVEPSSPTLTLKELADLNADVAMLAELEPNHSLASADPLALPAKIRGTIYQSDVSHADEDWYCFDADAGQPWILTAIATGKSPLDPRIEIRDESGQPVLRTRLQAVRESYFTFRGKNSMIADDFRLHRWEDMELNELLYCGGEVVKLWLYPRGPDSGFKVYPGEGNRQTYFDTTATSHALGEPVWIVQELEPDESPLPNGLPVFPIYFENDDDSTRKTGKNSRLIFTAPRAGRYFVRLHDSRHLQGKDYAYELTIRRQMKDYLVRTRTKSLSIVPGSGGEFSVDVDRIDDFDGAIDLTVEGLPKEVIVSQPLSIQAGQITAFGTIFIPQDIPASIDPFRLKISASALVDGQLVERQVVGEIPVTIGKGEVVRSKFAKSQASIEEPTEIVIRPGETISTFIAVERGKEKGDIPFGKEDSGRNLPHGIFVSNIGLSGLVVKPGETTREVFITAAPWVEPQTRPFHLRTTLKGNATTKPIQLRVVAP